MRPVEPASLQLSASYLFVNVTLIFSTHTKKESLKGIGCFTAVVTDAIGKRVDTLQEENLN